MVHYSRPYNCSGTLLATPDQQWYVICDRRTATLRYPRPRINNGTLSATVEPNGTLPATPDQQWYVTSDARSATVPTDDPRSAMARNPRLIKKKL